MIEVEVKLPVSYMESPEWNGKKIRSVEEKLLENGFTFKEHILERDTYFDVEEGRIRKSGQALRIRLVENRENGAKEGLVTFKGKRMDKETMTRPEYETGVEDPEVLRQMLLALGYREAKPVVQKERKILQKGTMSACLDHVEGLGDFLELEIMAAEESDKEEAVGELESVLHILGYSINDTVKTSYLSLLQRKTAPEAEGMDVYGNDAEDILQHVMKEMV